MHDLKLIIISEGPHHVAVFKPHNITVVGGRGVARPTLLDLVRERFGKNIFPVHRLDRVTAGITIFARSLFAKHAIDNAFKKRLVKKTYHAVCEGTPSFSTITVDRNLLKTSLNKANGPMKRQSVDSAGESAITKLRVLQTLRPGYCLIEAQPVSGRMHQIRAHLADVGQAIVGDKLYGAKTSYRPQSIALCAVKISLPLPKGGRLELNECSRFVPENYITAD